LNVINQSVIGAKEGVVEAVSKLVGSNITNAILRMADGSNRKSIDHFTLYEVMKVAIDGADRPFTNDVLEQLIEAINHTFDFCKKVSVNMELMQSNAVQMATYGIDIGIHSSCSHCWPTSRWPPNPIIDVNFAWPCTLSARSTHTITCTMQRRSKPFEQSAGADGVRALRDAPAPNAVTVHSVANSVSFLNSMMMNGNTTSEYTESAYGASSDSGSSEERCKSRECEHKKPKKAKACEKKKKEKDKDNEPKKNTCPHCKKYQRKKSHCIKPDQMHVEQEV